MILALEAAMGTVLAAAITATGAFLAGVIQFRRLRIENRDQHAAGQELNQSRWDDVMRSIGRVQGTVDVTRSDVAEGFNAVGKDIADLTGRVENLEERP